MGTGPGVLRIRLTNVVDTSARDQATRRLHGWLIERASQLRRERRPDLPAMLGTRCGAGDPERLQLLTDDGFSVVRWEWILVRYLNAAVLLHCLGTRPSWRRRGLAGAMIGNALSACRAAGHHRAELHVGGDNEEAVRLYTRLGFADTGRGHAILTCPLPTDR
ncbi:GNAT family N-acetyltransferase [Micromonospora globispora]